MKLAEWRLTIETDERDEVILDSACDALVWMAARPTTTTVKG